MLKKRPDTYIVSLDQEFPELTKILLNHIHLEYGQFCRVSDFIQILEIVCQRKFELFDPQTWNSGEFLSYLMDQVMKFRNGGSLDRKSVV